jgi:hypothetical protein
MAPLVGSSPIRFSQRVASSFLSPSRHLGLLSFLFLQTNTFLKDMSGIKSLTVWPLVDRAAFLLATGVSHSTLLTHIRKKQYPPEVLNTSGSRLLSTAAARIGFEPVESIGKARQTRLGLCSMASRITDWTEVGATGDLPTACAQLAPKGTGLRRWQLRTDEQQKQLQQEVEQPPPPSPVMQHVGDWSVTILRHPFRRAVSACMYKGHSPNYDVFSLRPGFWLHPVDKPPGYRSFNFHDYSE